MWMINQATRAGKLEAENFKVGKKYLVKQMNY
jgi:hypothetical protein